MATEDEELIQKIETGDSIKVKQVLDEALIEVFKEDLKYGINYTSDNIKLTLMFISCIFALIAQFNPYTFPENRWLIAGCCVG